MFTKVTLNSDKGHIEQPYLFHAHFFAQFLQGNLGLLILLHIIQLVSVYYTYSSSVNEIQWATS